MNSGPTFGPPAVLATAACSDGYHYRLGWSWCTRGGWLEWTRLDGPRAGWSVPPAIRSFVERDRQRTPAIVGDGAELDEGIAYMVTALPRSLTEEKRKRAGPGTTVAEVVVDVVIVPADDRPRWAPKSMGDLPGNEDYRSAEDIAAMASRARFGR